MTEYYLVCDKGPLENSPNGDFYWINGHTIGGIGVTFLGTPDSLSELSALSHYVTPFIVYSPAGKALAKPNQWGSLIEFPPRSRPCVLPVDPEYLDDLMQLHDGKRVIELALAVFRSGELLTREIYDDLGRLMTQEPCPFIEPADQPAMPMHSREGAQEGDDL